MASLPPHWTKYTSEDGKDYYHNALMNTTQWEVPTDSPIQSPLKETTEQVKTINYGSSKSSFASRIPCAFCLPGLGFLTSGFDVDTSDVKSRLLATVALVNVVRPFKSDVEQTLPGSQTPSDIAAVFGSKPDLYGPFWIATTAILTATIAANSSAWLDADKGVIFFADYSLMGKMATFIYSSFALVVGIIWLLSWKIPNLNVDLALVSCVYGYSMSPLVLVALVSPFFNGMAHTLTVLLGFAWSIFICFRLLWLPTAVSLTKNARVTIFGVPFLVHAISYGLLKYITAR
jgi:hypothetical protein